MIFRIKQGKHRAWPPKLWLWRNKKSITRKVTFDFNCKYDLGDADQADHNKLFGIGYFPNHHVDSARFGWRYDNKDGRIIISAYCYIAGQRVMVDICNVPASKAFYMEIKVKETSYDLKVIAAESGSTIGTLKLPCLNKKKWSYPLGPYFGGNQTAPHDMSITIKKV